MSKQAVWLSSICALVGSGILLGWGMGQLRAGFQHERTFAHFQFSVPELAEMENPTPLARYELRLADYFSEDVFPPDNALALEHCKQAILLDPLFSKSWMMAAREQIYLGNDDQARVALSRSDELDPHYPAERLQAISLWNFLGDRDQGLAIAEAIGRLGKEYRADVAQELILNGYSLEEIFAVTRFDQLGPDELIPILEQFHQFGQQHWPEVIARIPDYAYSDSEFRHSMSRMASESLDTDLLVRLWQLEKGNPVLEANRVWLNNQDLNSPAFDRHFTLGWQPISEDLDLSLAWRSVEGRLTLRRDGFLELKIPRYRKKPFHWTFYKALVLPGEETVLAVQLASHPEDQNDVRLIAKAPRLRVGGTSIDSHTIEDQELQVLLPASDYPMIYEFILEWSPAFNESRSTASTITLQAIGAAVPPSEPAPLSDETDAVSEEISDE